MELTCPGCQTILRVADSDAGKQARCPKCQTVFLIPAGGDSNGSSSGTTPDAGSGFPAPAAPQDSGFSGASSQSQSSSASDDLGQSFSGGEQANPRWYLKIEDGRMFGPVPRAELDQWFKENRITANCELRTESDLNWRSANSVYPELGQASLAASNPFSDAAHTPGASPYQTPGYGRMGMEPHRGGLILTMGILGIFCCGIMAIVAIILGQSDLKKMKQGQMDPSGQGLTNAGFILGIIGTVLMALGIVLQIVMAAAG